LIVEYDRRERQRRAKRGMGNLREGERKRKTAEQQRKKEQNGKLEEGGDK